MTNETVALDIPPHWNESQDDHYYKTHHGHETGNPHDFMAGRLKTAASRFEGCLDHALEFMRRVDTLPGLITDHMPRSGVLTNLPPAPNEQKIQILLELFNQMLRPWAYHKTFTALMKYLLEVEKLRQQVGYKMSCSGQTIFLREIAELVRALDQAIAKVDSTLADYYDPFYKRILETTMTSQERSKKLLSLAYEEVDRARKAKVRIAKQKTHTAIKPTRVTSPRPSHVKTPTIPGSQKAFDPAKK